MTYAIRVNGFVVQLFDEKPDLYHSIDLIDVSTVAGIQVGWIAKGDGSFEAPPEPTPVADPIPDVSSAQAKIQLKRAGFLKAVKDAVDTTADEEVQIWFSDARVWQRNNPHVVAIGAAIPLPADKIDELFREAAKIDA